MPCPQVPTIGGASIDGVTESSTGTMGTAVSRQIMRHWDSFSFALGFFAFRALQVKPLEALKNPICLFVGQ